MAETSFCYHEDEVKAKEIAYRWWPIVANRGDLNWLPPSWSHYGQLQQMGTPDRVVEKYRLRPGPRAVRREGRRRCGDFGFDRIVIHQAGPEQGKSLRFAKDELLPALRLISHYSRGRRPGVPAATAAFASTDFEGEDAGAKPRRTSPHR